jgi:hypothetical protein
VVRGLTSSQIAIESLYTLKTAELDNNSMNLCKWNCANARQAYISMAFRTSVCGYKRYVNVIHSIGRRDQPGGCPRCKDSSVCILWLK